MSMTVVLDAQKLQSVHTKVDALVDSRNKYVKDLFLNSLAQGHSHDSIGYLYEKTLEKFEKKNIGQYYTPKPIVEYMISQLEIREDSTILDPSCGCGSFLLNIFDIYKHKYGVKCVKNIFGVDVNDDAANMTRLCLYAKTGLKDSFLSSIKNNIRTGNSLSSNRVLSKNAFNWHTEFSNIMHNGGFDFIIGNPPYVTVKNDIYFDISESIYTHIVNGPVNAATLMIGRCIELLKDGGVLTFLLPKSILYVDSYAKLRSYLVSNTEILQIYDLGARFKDVRGEQFILFIRKTFPNTKSKTKLCIFTDKKKPLEKQSSIVVGQNLLQAIS